jgi:hypothetical protein
MTERPKISSKQIAPITDAITPLDDAIVSETARSMERLIEAARKMESDRRFRLALGRALAATFRRPYADFPPEAAARLVLDQLEAQPDEYLRQNLPAAVLGALSLLSRYDWNTTDDPMWFRTLSWDEVANSDPPSWLIQGVLPAAGVAMLWGPSGSYKSFVALDIAAHVCQGWDWAGHSCAKPWDGFGGADKRLHRVLYVAGEGNMSARTACWAAHHGFPDFGEHFDFIVHPVDLLDADTVWDLAESANHRRYALIVIDTLARSIPGADENSAQDMGKAMDAVADIARSADASVLLIHHTGKDSSRGERGSSAIRGAVEASLEMKKLGDLRASVEMRKQRDAEDEGTMRLRMQQVTINAGRATEMSSLVPVVDNSPPAPSKDATEPTKTARAVSAARQYREEHGRWPTVSELAEATGVSDATASRALQPLRQEPAE